MKKRVALYCRVSSEEQERHGLSLAEQERSLEEYAKKNNYKVVGRYIDGGVSGRKKYTKRPELMRLLDDVKDDKIDIILFIKLDRWTRNVESYYDIQKVLDEHNVSWQATEEDYETVTANGRFKVNIMLSVAQDEADRTSERIKFVFEGKRDRGEPLNGKVPKGYKIVNKQVVLDDETAPLIRKFFLTYIETGSIAKASKEVPQLNLTRQSLYNIVRTAHFYTGEYRGKNIPPILSKEEYDAVMTLRGHTVRKTKGQHTYLFSGLLICPNCGRRLCAKLCHKMDKYTYIYYICGSYNNDSGCGHSKSYNEKHIEEYFLTHIESQASLMIETEKGNKGKSYKKERDALLRKLSKLSELYVDDLISMDDYKRQYKELNDALDAVPPDERPVDYQKIQSAFFPDWQSVYSELTQEDKQKFWRKLIKSATPNGHGGWDFSFN